MIKYLTIAATAFAVVAGPASALSCMPTHPVAAFNAVAEADESFVVLHGAFEFDVKRVPDVNAPPLEVKIPTVFKGKLLTGGGFTDEIEVPVSLSLNCVGPWCARVSPKTNYLAYVLQTEDELIFNVDPCYAFAFPNPEQKYIEAVEQCASGGDCTPK
ncbi:hypothetical protein [Litoreibacter janthinus]|uniref:Tissue inhibitor of metalloproteinase n=1 Tax=Litoreibacter janthinus TaxID=670154 RepID=A0A1I6FYQ4_9RHOB|nr:hypothetical protein [Litoreibacter janthinus]SFR35075.1 hypothetical protein SAMN04488002_0582 [Litoreibacter janthinus]